MARADLRSELTDEEWGKIYDEMSRRNLIDVDFALFEEKVPLEDGDELEEKFQALEGDCVRLIRSRQDVEEQLELIAKEREKVLQKKGVKQKELIEKRTRFLRNNEKS